jgi:hypothetical protein
MHLLCGKCSLPTYNRSITKKFSKKFERYINLRHQAAATEFWERMILSIQSHH